MGCCLSSAPDIDDDDAAAPFTSVTHEFTIRRYSQTKGIGPGKSILSRYFTVDGRTWYVRFYPDGYGIQPSAHVAFFVQTLYKPHLCAVRAHFTFALLKPDGTVAHSRRSDRPSSFDGYCNSWGFREFITRDALESPALGVLHDDSIRARCTVHVINAKQHAYYRRKKKADAVVVPQSDFAINAMDFLSSGRAPFDVKFSVDGVTFEAHKLVVAARSDWFAAAIYGHGDARGRREETCTWVEASMPCIAVEGTTPEAFEAVLHYIYHDTVPDEETMKDRGDTVMTREIFEAADMFLIERLKKMCANRMCRFIKDDTVEGIMDLAKAHCCKELERACQNHLNRRRAIVRR
ncbi:hypothetical protein QOZ80_4AG0300840 [Eleusine coracana subsp. coracana]|nr:hypothetical protein QOZ80_4AG0300840 [Eleusine coracana subsp. coracana]